jgi:hypothetical protein
VAEELAVHPVPEAVAQDAKGAGLVPEAASRFRRGEMLNEVRAQGFVLSLASFRRLEEEASVYRYRNEPSLYNL